MMLTVLRKIANTGRAVAVANAARALRNGSAIGVAAVVPALLLAALAVVTVMVPAGGPEATARDTSFAANVGPTPTSLAGFDTEPPASGARGIEPVLIPWRMVLVPFEKPEQEVVVSGTIPAPEGVEDGQEITLVVYHRDADAPDAARPLHGAPPAGLPADEHAADELPEWLRHDIGTFGGVGTRVASEVYYMVTGPGHEEIGFEIELVRPQAHTGSM